MNKLIFFFILFIFISNCSLNTKTGFWNKSETQKEDKPEIKKIFKKAEIHEKEFNPKIRINILKKSKFKINSFVNNLTNNNGHINYGGELKKISKYKFPKINQFEFVQPDLLFTKDKSIIFFDNKGNIFKFSSDLGRLWNVNH